MMSLSSSMNGSQQFAPRQRSIWFHEDVVQIAKGLVPSPLSASPSDGTSPTAAAAPNPTVKKKNIDFVRKPRSTTSDSNSRSSRSPSPSKPSWKQRRDEQLVADRASPERLLVHTRSDENTDTVERLVSRLTTMELKEISIQIGHVSRPLDNAFAIGIVLEKLGVAHLHSEELEQLLLLVNPPYEFPQTTDQAQRAPLSFDQLIQAVAILKEEHRLDRLTEESVKIETDFDCDNIGIMDMRELFVAFGGHRDESGEVHTSDVAEGLRTILVHPPELSPLAPSESSTHDAMENSERPGGLYTFFTRSRSPSQAQANDRRSSQRSPQKTRTRRPTVASLDPGTLSGVFVNQSQTSSTFGFSPSRTYRSESMMEPSALNPSMMLLSPATLSRAKELDGKVEACFNEALAVAKARAKNKSRLDFHTFVNFVETFRDIAHGFQATDFATVDLDVPIETDLLSEPVKSTRVATSKARRKSSASFKEVARMLTATIRAQAQVKDLHAEITDRAMLQRVIDRHKAKLKRAMTPQVTTALEYDAIRDIDVLLPSGELLPAGKKPIVKHKKVFGKAPSCVQRDKEHQDLMLGDLRAQAEAEVEAHLQQLDEVRLQSVAHNSLQRKDRAKTPSARQKKIKKDAEPVPSQREMNNFVKLIAQQNALLEKDNANSELDDIERSKRAKKYEATVRTTIPRGGDSAAKKKRGKHNALDDDIRTLVLLCDRAPPLEVELPSNCLTSHGKVLSTIQEPLSVHVGRHEAANNLQRKRQTAHSTKMGAIRSLPTAKGTEVLPTDVFYETTPCSGSFLPVSDPLQELVDGVRVKVYLSKGDGAS